jgi:plasmid stabilization system protein ParE
MAEVNWTAEAERWLHDIYAYIAKDNPAAAARTLQAIYEKADLLRRFPELGYRDSRHSGKHVRILLFGHYRIAYLIKSSGDIDILCVFHGALEIERYFS